ncbi:MAG: hypothetical protein JXB03_12515 [Spirochaetales bacterium]|nr:hypothetical protein [Spirochaetales bacterium]
MARKKHWIIIAIMLAFGRLWSQEAAFRPLLVESSSSAYEIQETDLLLKGQLPLYYERPLSWAEFSTPVQTPRAFALPFTASYFLYDVSAVTALTLGTLAPEYAPRLMREFTYAEDGLADTDGDSIPDTQQSGSNYGTVWGFLGSTKKMTSYASCYETWQLPSVLTLNTAVTAGPFCLHYRQDIRGAYSYYAEDRDMTNIPASADGLDVNFPYRAYINYYSRLFEASLGRDSLHSGPGRHSLTLNERIPYYDYLRFRIKTGMINHTTWLIRLNPVLSSGEMQYINYLYDNWEAGSFTEPNASWNPRIFDQSKHYIVSKLGIHPQPWLHIDLSQIHLVGGRVPQLPDFNPLMVYHNLYEEGQYSVPISIAAALLPLPGLKIYGEVLIYDLEFGNELASSNSTNPNALAFQAGFSYALRPGYTGKGTLRFDAEWNYAMPWVYAEESSYRNMSSRMVFTDPYRGRKWVDFPLGFHRGPDSFEQYCAVTFRETTWDLGLSWTFSGKGSVYLEEYGTASPVARKDEYKQKGLLTERDGERICYEHDLRLSGNVIMALPAGELSLRAELGLHAARNLNHVPGYDKLYPVGTVEIGYRY